MAIKRPDIYEHNNPNNAIVDSDGVRGGKRKVATLTDLYSLSNKIDQLKEDVTVVYVEAENNEYKLVDITNVSNSNGWSSNELINDNEVVLDKTWSSNKINHLIETVQADLSIEYMYFNLIMDNKNNIG
jgi:hypothetical protein